MNLHLINEEIDKLIKEVRALERVLFKVDEKFSYKLKKIKEEKWNKINFLKTMKKIRIMNKDNF